MKDSKYFFNKTAYLVGMFVLCLIISVIGFFQHAGGICVLFGVGSIACLWFALWHFDRYIEAVKKEMEEES